MSERGRQSGGVGLVTGGVRRIGAMLARRLVERGFRVVIHSSARSLSEARALASELGGPDRAASLCADLADAAAAARLVDEAAQRFGPLSLLVNNASIFEDDRAEKFDPARFDRMLAINLRAPLILASRFAAQAREEDRPCIINLLDQRVFAPNPLYLSYSLSKAALAEATIRLAQAFAPQIRVNGIAPGPVLANGQEGQASFDAEAAAVPLAEPVALEALADALDYLTAAHHVTGQVIAVDSGQRLAWETPDVVAAAGKR